MKRFLCVILILLLSLGGLSYAEEAIESEPTCETEIVECDPGEEVIPIEDSETVIEDISPSESDIEPDIEPEETDEAEEFLRIEGSEPEMVVGVQSITIGVRESVSVPVTFTDGVARACTFRVKSTKYAKVNGEGIVTGVRTGSTILRVESELGYIDITVNVKKAPSKVTILETKLTAGVDETRVLHVSLPKGSASGIKWTVEDPTVAEISEDGSIHALCEGTTRVKAETYNGKRSIVTLNVLAAPECVEIPDERSLGVGQKAALNATLSAGSAGTIVFESSDPAVVAVDESGYMTAKAIGNCVITARTYNGCTDECAVTVLKAPSSIALEKKSIVLGVGEQYSVPVVYDDSYEFGLSYSTSNKKCATVSAAGVVIAVKRGTATITAVTYNGKKAKLTVKVVYAPTKVVLSPSMLTLGAGQTFKLNASVPKNSAGKYSFESKDPQIVTTDPAGNITAQSAGETEIVCTTYNGVSATCSVTVEPAPTSITLDTQEISIGAAQSFVLTATPDHGTRKCTFTSSDPSIATVEANTGKVRAISAGETVITAEAYNGVKAYCRVIVRAAPEKIILGTDSTKIAVGDTIRVPLVRIEPEGCVTDGTEYAASSSVIKVDADGNITAVKTGNATVIVKTYNGVKAVFKVTVVAAPKSLVPETTDVIMRPDARYTPKIAFDNGIQCSYTMSSSNEKFVSVDDDGVSLVSYGIGEADVTFTAYNGMTATIHVRVLNMPETFGLSSSTVTMKVGNTSQLEPVFADGCGDYVSYVSSDKAIATVSATGVIKAVHNGRCIITATTESGLTARCEVTVGRVIADISHYNEITDFDKFADSVDFVILRATCGMVKDTKFEKYARELNKRGVPFGVYCYGKAQSVSDAKAEADYLYSVASPYSPKFYVYDAETSYLQSSYIKAFTARLRELGAGKVGIYCAHHKYEAYGLSGYRNIFDFVWIPRYGKNDGTLQNSTKPNYSCDLWQYTSRGSVPGVSGNVDLNIITGTGRALSWFRN